MDIVLSYGRKILRQINKIHERTLCIFYTDYTSFDELIEKPGSVTIHHRNLQQLATEIYEAIINVIKQCNYNLGKEFTLVSNNPSSTNYGINSISHLVPKIWEQILNEIRTIKSLNIFT